MTYTSKNTQILYTNLKKITYMPLIKYLDENGIHQGNNIGFILREGLDGNDCFLSRSTIESYKNARIIDTIMNANIIHVDYIKQYKNMTNILRIIIEKTYVA